MAGIGKVKSLLTTPDSLAAYRRNLGASELDPSLFVDPSKPPKADAENAVRTVQEHVDDAPNWGLTPEELIGGIDLDFANPAVTQLAGNEFFRHMKEQGEKYRPTNRHRDLRNTITGNARTVMAPSPVTSRHMGESGNNMAITQVRPSQLLDNLTGDPEHSKKIALRQSMRNLPYGKDRAHIYHSGNHIESLEQPWMFFRDLDDALPEKGGTQGYAHPVSRTVWMNAGRDPTYGNLLDSRGPMNVGTHEGIHTILDGQHPSMEHQRTQRYMAEDSDGPYTNPNARPAVAGIRHSLLQPHNRYAANDSAEIGNLLFHTKRLTENTHSGMRDVGENMGTLDNWLDFARKYQFQGVDPIIDKPGHPQEGLRAHGFEDQIRTIQDILNNANPEAMEDIRDINFKTAQTPDLRKALLG
jgi:hypothetical protein